MIKYFFLLLCGNVFLVNIYSQKIDWEKFLDRNDMIFDTLTSKWEEAIYTGNGLLGNMIYMKDSQSLRMEIGRTDVVDHRYSKKDNHLYTKARLPIGYFLLRPKGKIIHNTARLHLWNAEATGIIETDKGRIEWRSLSLTKENVIIFQAKTEGEETDFTWKFVVEESVSPRIHFKPIDNFPSNPESRTGERGGIDYSLQPMLAGGDYVTAWKVRNDSNTQTYYITESYDSTHSSLKQAVSIINNAYASNFDNSITEHRNWWHQFYQKSFLSLPDARIESFYWIQLYKIASATRSNTLPVDLMGPWFAPTPWPAYWYNLNIQLTYSPLFKSNHLDLAEPFVKSIDKNFQNLIDNVPAEYRYNAASIGRSGAGDMISSVKVSKSSDTTLSPSESEVGDLIWMLYYYWQYYSYSQDAQALHNLLPILKRSVNYCLDIMHKENDGKWHFPSTYSPEYPGGMTSDCNYALSLFRWGCETLLKIAPEDKLADKWKDVLQNLTPYPTDSTGLRIGRDVGFTKSHRHYSHLLMIYPLHLLTPENNNDLILIDRSLNHWHSLKGAFQGYSFTGGASMYALMGKGDSALGYLNQLFDHYVKPNTMYLESGPVIETPLAAAATIQEFFLESRNGKIIVFPAMPTLWKDISFENMLTDGAFSVSAVRKDGETQWIKIQSITGGKCTIVSDLKGNVHAQSDHDISLINKENHTYEMILQKGQSVTIYSDEKALKVPVEQVNEAVNNIHYWGTKRKL